MARTSENLTATEIQVFKSYCERNKIICDESVEGIANADHLGNYICFQWNEDITEKTLAVAFEKLRDRLVFQREKSAAESRYDSIAVENPAAAQALEANYSGHRLDPVFEFEDSALLLGELRGRDITRDTVAQAVGRISYKAGPQLHFIALPSRVDARQYQSDGSGFLGEHVNESRYQRVTRERAEWETKNVPKTNTQDIQDRARTEAENLQGDTHGQTETIRGLLVATGGDVDWVRTLAARKEYQHNLNNRSVR